MGRPWIRAARPSDPRRAPGVSGRRRLEAGTDAVVSDRPSEGPLAGRLIAVTRARDQASELASRLEARGAVVLAVPTISFADPEDWGPLDAALGRIGSFDWVIFTSVNGVKWTFERAAAVAPGALPPAGSRRPKVAAIGPATAAALAERGMPADLVPPVYKAEELAESLPLDEMRGQRILLARAQVAREVLPAMLRKAGADVTVAPCYRTLLPSVDTEELGRRLVAGEIHAITFTSSSTVSHFAALFPEGRAGWLLRCTRAVCIGPVTAATLRQLGVEPAAVADPFTIDGLVDALVHLLAPSGPPGFRLSPE